ncbi:LCP family glycopolymer transferase [Siminovitchia terrae]|uniref:LCP family glycopolymer transferase n=1 Tax=Siminovitchia terrae TaxID=1914933 RepID=UPI0028AE3F34|nr:LCP family protein [Siminovitchia terrae]
MKKILYTSIAVSVMLLLITVGYFYNQYKLVEKTVGEMQISFDKDNNSIREKVKKSESVLFLLLGIGDRPGDPGRADSIMCISVNQTDKSILMFNIPRDTRTEIIGKGIQDKINHSYAYGRTEMTKNTVEHFLGQSIDYVVQINMQGMRQLVDTIDGIEVENAFAFSQGDELGQQTYHFDKGLIQLDGERALHYSRMRKKDPRGDLGRNERQRQVLQALVQKATAFSSVLKIKEVVGVLGENIKTNISFEEMKFFYSQFAKEWKNYDIETMEIKGNDKTIDGIYYYTVSDEERENIADRLEEHLNSGFVKK